MSEMHEEDAKLVPKLLAGDEGAYRLAVSIYHGAMIRLARAIAGQAIAEEIVQEAWIKAIGALAAFEGRSSLRLWLLRIVRNEAISRLRQKARTPETDGLDDEALSNRYDENGGWRTPPAIWSLDTPEAILAAKDMRNVIEKALDALPAMQRSVLTLRDIEGLQFEEICNILDLSASNARVLLHRARRHLWGAIDDYQRK